MKLAFFLSPSFQLSLYGLDSGLFFTRFQITVAFAGDSRDLIGIFSSLNIYFHIDGRYVIHRDHPEIHWLINDRGILKIDNDLEFSIEGSRETLCTKLLDLKDFVPISRFQIVVDKIVD